MIIAGATWVGAATDIIQSFAIVILAVTIGRIHR